MSERQGKHDLKSLVSQILTTPQTPEPAAPPVATPPDAPPPEPALDPELQALIEVYFDLDEPAERDVLFEKIVAIDSPVVTEFLHEMLLHDEDDVVRAGAAAELARRGEAAGIAALEEALHDRDDTELCAHALQVLAETQGAAFYERAQALWLGEDGDAELRHEALLAMESCDAARALPEWAAYIDQLTDMNALPDDHLEVIMMAFVRHGFRQAVPALQNLQSRLRNAIGDADERDELAAFVGEGIALLESAD